MRVNRRKLFIALSSAVVCFALLVSSSFAWLTMSSTPEITGIETNVGANGSLEIALLTGHTYMHPDEIRTAIGSSAERVETTVSNITWGNVIDLRDGSYGLDKISLLPARLDVTALLGRNSVSNNLLTVPDYSEDGRFSGFNDGIVSGAYQGDDFYYDPAQSQHGVRGIGTVSNITAQRVALTEAKASVVSYQSAATNATKSVWRANGPGLFDIFYRLYAMGAESFTLEDVAVLRDTATRLLGILDYVDSAMRQGVIGYAASQLHNESEFKALCGTVNNVAVSLSDIVKNLSVSLPDDFKSGIARLDRDTASLKAAVAYCDQLESKTPDRDDIIITLEKCGLLDPAQAFLGDRELAEMDSELQSDNRLKLFVSDGKNGVLDGISGYIGSYSVIFTFVKDTIIEVEGDILLGKPVLTGVAEDLGALTTAGSANEKPVVMEDMYGYAIDMAFRCNATSNLMLQTVPMVVTDENTGFTREQGGSYMTFQRENLTQNQLISLMDAIRIGFLDNHNDLVAIAKLNTSNYEQTEDGISAPLYLYNYVVAADGSISVGERRKDDAAIIELQDSVPTVLTVVIWLDGDHVENSFVTAGAQNVTGLLNLQFTSSAELHPVY